MKKTLITIISFIIFLFFCVRGAVFSVCPLSFCACGLNLPKSVRNQCVSEAYLYKSSSGCKVVRFDFSKRDFVAGEFCFFSDFIGSEFFGAAVLNCGGVVNAIKSVKGERLFLPKAELIKSGLNFEEIRDFFVKRLSAEKIFCEQAGCAYNEYYYSRAIKNYSVIKGEKVNLQICKTSAGVSVASPIAFGSY